MSTGSAGILQPDARMGPQCECSLNRKERTAPVLVYAWVTSATGNHPSASIAPSAISLVFNNEEGGSMRSREVFFSAWQAADYAGLKIDALYELLESGEVAADKIEGRWRVRKSVLDAWLDAEVSPEELEKLTSKMSRLSEEQAREVLAQVQAQENA